MGRVFVTYLEGRKYSCKYCRTHLASADAVLSKGFQCQHGRAYLFDKVMNVTTGTKEERMMMTGIHTVVDLFCTGCGSLVGWKYETAPEKNLRYKVGRSILERMKLLGPNGNQYLADEENQQHIESDGEDEVLL
ncbi:hypothetical protein M569_07194 [Genlisea aurea]|uniref:Protein yippee-like n=1 Tax=Genlisea aurea TaxID=192259 RepID=S8CRT7_9LAMI|nr:hypothetical protein M569_07194 [Genlisea aurea]